MSKQILVITGSPRRDGNSEMMANAFIKGALSKGHNVTKFEAARKAIGGCKACGTCWSKGTACTFKDGFTELEPFLESADTIVFASPLYLFGMSAQMKAPIDKLNAYDSENCIRPLKIKESVMLICGACEGTDIFNGVIATYKSMTNYMKWENAGILAIPQIYAKGDIIKTDALIQAEQMGNSI